MFSFKKLAKLLALCGTGKKAGDRFVRAFHY